MRFSIKIFRYSLLQLCIFLLFTTSFSQTKQILILFEGSDVPANYARGDARELAMLLGHFAVDYKMEGVDSYKSGEINNYDLTFFIGFSKRYDPPDKFLHDVYSSQNTFVWMNTGMERFSKKFDLKTKFGFNFVQLDTVSNFDIVTAAKHDFTKGEPI